MSGVKRSGASGAVTIGVLALQGDVREHLEALRRHGLRGVEVKTREGLAGVDGLIIPGGESTTVAKLLERFGLREPLVERIRAGMPTWGTCMGMIVLAKEVVGLPDQPTLGVLDVTVRRNAFGRQVESAEVPLRIAALGPQAFPGVFIRAPWVERAGEGVEVLCSLEGKGVMVRQGNILGTSFHPELTRDGRIHAWFAQWCGRVKNAA
ncbi:MAG TPA: pyridoxal 5'-phosphate synthase glutaminase subunit PdxT [Candidatus Dormibacteraeota bacterium]|nr:pyridoxal 5'-phosphate synthase glutaminase subunit PdxT [Candidatus Dormibacteraeota bacterium]